MPDNKHNRSDRKLNKLKPQSPQADTSDFAAITDVALPSQRGGKPKSGCRACCSRCCSRFQLPQFRLYLPPTMSSSWSKRPFHVSLSASLWTDLLVVAMLFRLTELALSHLVPGVIGFWLPGMLTNCEQVRYPVSSSISIYLLYIYPIRVVFRYRGFAVIMPIVFQGASGSFFHEHVLFSTDCDIAKLGYDLWLGIALLCVNTIF
jgi:hypothetical protein